MEGYGTSIRRIISRLAATACFTAGLLASPADGQIIIADSNVGYIDSAIPMTQLRLRFDAAYDLESPDRAEFFWPTWTPGAPGPPIPEDEVDYQEYRTHLEYAVADRASVFAELPIRAVDPEFNDNTAGFSDIEAGLKYAFLMTDTSVASYQFRTYIPTGDGRRGLGTEHVSLEPGLLLFHKLSDRLIFEGEFRDWIPIGATDGFGSNILRYGAGLSYQAHQSCCYSVSPVAEFVGWTVLDGKKSNAAGQLSEADGDTIGNLKIGTRITFNGNSFSACGAESLYAGYGRALTGDVWYEDTFRLEYRMSF